VALAAADDHCPGSRESPMCVEAPSPGGGQPAPKPRVPDCRKCIAEATAYQLTYPETCIPTCQKGKGNEDFFTRKQSCNGESWCVTKFGDEIKGSRVKGNKVDCSKFKDPAPPKTACQIASADGTKKKSDFVFKCNKDGTFFHTQCYGKGKNKPYCWCCMPNGRPLPFSFHSSKSKKAPNCNKHYTTDLKCGKFEGLKVHPFDCTRYANCGPQSVFSCKCPKGQAFDVKLKVCNWIGNVKGCKAP